MFKVYIDSSWLTLMESIVKWYSLTICFFSFAPFVFEMTFYSAEGNPVGNDPK